MSGPARTTTTEIDGTVTEYDDVPVAGDTVERLLTEIFTRHGSEVFAGPIIEGPAYEIRFTTPPAVTMLDGYMTVDGEHRGTPSAELARLHRVGRAAFFRTEGGSCAPGSWGLRLWNGRGEQMITIFFPSPWLDDDMRRLARPRMEKTALWETLRRRYTADGAA